MGVGGLIFFFFENLFGSKNDLEKVCGVGVGGLSVVFFCSGAFGADELLKLVLKNHFRIGLSVFYDSNLDLKKVVVWVWVV